jgi:hypothetical protein
MDHVSLYSARRKPARQPEAVAAGFGGKRDPRDCAPGPDRLILPAMQQGKQPFWVRLELLARLTLNPGKHAGNEPARFVADSLLEEGVSSEPVSEAKFPASRELTGNFRNYVADAPRARMGRGGFANSTVFRFQTIGSVSNWAEIGRLWDLTHTVLWITPQSVDNVDNLGTSHRFASAPFL